MHIQILEVGDLSEFSQMTADLITVVHIRLLVYLLITYLKGWVSEIDSVLLRTFIH